MVRLPLLAVDTCGVQRGATALVLLYVLLSIQLLVIRSPFYSVLYLYCDIHLFLQDTVLSLNTQCVETAIMLGRELLASSGSQPTHHTAGSLCFNHMKRDVLSLFLPIVYVKMSSKLIEYISTLSSFSGVYFMLNIECTS